MGFTTPPHEQGLAELVRNYRQRNTRLRGKNKLRTQIRLNDDVNAVERNLLYGRDCLTGLVEALRWEAEILTAKRHDPEGIGWTQDYARVRKIIDSYLGYGGPESNTLEARAFFDDGKLVRVRASRMRSRVGAAHGVHLSDTAWATLHYVMGGSYSLYSSLKDPAATGLENSHDGREELVDAGLITGDLPIDEGIVAPFVGGRPVMATDLGRRISGEYHAWIRVSLRPKLES